MANKTYETWAEIDLGAVENNLKQVQNISGLPAAAVLKADAYGHGVLPVSRAAVKAGAVFLAVARFSEARELRNAGFTEPILVLGMIPPENVIEAFPWVARYRTYPGGACEDRQRDGTARFCC